MHILSPGQIQTVFRPMVVQREDLKAPRTILVVDEHAPSADALVAALVAGGYEASAAYGTAEAIVAVRTVRFGLVVVDVKAPAPEGLVLGSTLCQQFDVPLLFLSALRDEETVRQATALGAIGYLVRHQDVRDCIPTIETALARVPDLKRLRQKEAPLSLDLKQHRTTGMAIGILVERLHLDRDEAYETLCRNARNRQRSVIDVAEQIVTSAEAVNEIVRPEPRTQRPDD